MIDQYSSYVLQPFGLHVSSLRGGRIGPSIKKIPSKRNIQTLYEIQFPCKAVEDSRGGEGGVFNPTLPLEKKSLSYFNREFLRNWWHTEGQAMPIMPQISGESLWNSKQKMSRAGPTDPSKVKKYFFQGFNPSPPPPPPLSENLDSPL